MKKQQQNEKSAANKIQKWFRKIISSRKSNGMSFGITDDLLEYDTLNSKNRRQEQMIIEEIQKMKENLNEKIDHLKYFSNFQTEPKQENCPGSQNFVWQEQSENGELPQLVAYNQKSQPEGGLDIDYNCYAEDLDKIQFIQRWFKNKYTNLLQAALKKSVYQRIITLSDELDRQKSINQQLEDSIAELQSQFTKKIEEELLKQQKECQEVLVQYKGFIDKLMQDKKFFSQQNKILTEQNVHYKQQAEESLAQIQLLQQQLESHSSTHQSQSTQIEQLQGQIRELSQHIEGIEEKVSEKFIQEIDQINKGHSSQMQELKEQCKQKITEIYEKMSKQISERKNEHEHNCNKKQAKEDKKVLELIEINNCLRQKYLDLNLKNEELVETNQQSHLKIQELNSVIERLQGRFDSKDTVDLQSSKENQILNAHRHSKSNDRVVLTEKSTNQELFTVKKTECLQTLHSIINDLKSFSHSKNN